MCSLIDITDENKDELVKTFDEIGVSLRILLVDLVKLKQSDLLTEFTEMLLPWNEKANKRALSLKKGNELGIP
jgi:hypothetical protein